MPITANGTTYSDDQIKSFFAANPDASSVAKQAASMGLSEGQIKQASDIAGKGWSDSDINNFASANGYGWGGSNGALQAPGSGGGGQPAQSSTAGQGPGMYTPQGQWLSQADIQQFYKNGGDDVQFAQTHGYTNLDSQRAGILQARQLAGAGTMQGDAALKHYYAMYQKLSPNGANANNYAGWLADVKSDPAKWNAIQTGAYTGQGWMDSKDSDFGGIYGPGTGHDVSYAQNGQGALGQGDGWGALGGAAGAANPLGATAVTGSATGSGGTGATGGTSGMGSAGAGTTGATPWNVTTPQTVAGQLQSLMDPNNGNGIIARARLGAIENMNARGLANSSLAQTASDEAAWNAALPIAQQDATTNANAGQFNASGQNQFNLNSQNQANTMAQLGFNAQTQKDLAQAGYLYSNLQNQTAQASSIQQWGLNTITAIQTSDLSADAKNAAVAMVTQYLQNSYQIQGDWHTSAAQAIANIFGKQSASTTPAAQQGAPGVATPTNLPTGYQ